MNRYFIELSYMGTNYSGFQVQENAKTIQSEVEKALSVYFKEKFALTGSSRTDAGVHARQNFFHFDSSIEVSAKVIYNLNALLPPDIAIRHIFKVPGNIHCRFDAVSRNYRYYVCSTKTPHLFGRAYHYPFKIDKDILLRTAEIVRTNTNFKSFSKRNTQVHTFDCKILESEWDIGKDVVIYNIRANRFLRGMVRGLVATMLKTARGSISVENFADIFVKRNCAFADFSAPPQGLFLEEVLYNFSFE
ncbi:MAG TPA: tRNA pseudouridine(38-40) synthase TruA [Panacibacter sp.]|nr:tRNA pseudouridine(38-40) synthase TruA [Panacibacter sp.]HNP45961.1 tRNA pseudouridine(38-40) synthase TruA [Panacibacter sp.]